MQQFYCAQSPLLHTGQRVTASPLTQLTKISYRNVNPWCKHTSDSCSVFKEITYCTFDTSVWSSPWMRRKWNGGGGGGSHQEHSWQEQDKNAVKVTEREGKYDRTLKLQIIKSLSDVHWSLSGAENKDLEVGGNNSQRFFHRIHICKCSNRKQSTTKQFIFSLEMHQRSAWVALMLFWDSGCVTDDFSTHKKKTNKKNLWFWH